MKCDIQYMINKVVGMNLPDDILIKNLRLILDSVIIYKEVRQPSNN